jgi:hypothetical protein
MIARRAMAKVAVLVPAIGLLLGSGAGPVRAAGGWVPFSSDHVSGSNEIINAIAVPAADDAWVIGYRWGFVGGTAEFRTLAEHSTGGGAFHQVPTPDRETAPARDFLRGAASVAPSDVWAVGTSVGQGTPDLTLVEHWNGTSWSLVNAPNPGANGNDLEAVAASGANDVWVVGARVDEGAFYQVPLTMHWNGATWTTFHAPNPAGCTGHSYLTAVRVLRPASVWATGWCGSGGSTSERGYVLHWNGTKWAVAFVVPQTSAPESELYGIAVGGNSNVWIVGTFRAGASRVQTALAVHFDGTAWSVTALPASAITLAGITNGSRGVWTVGAGDSSQPPFAGPSASSWNAHTGAWSDRSPAQPDFGRLNAITTSPDGKVWAAGRQILPSGDDTALILNR